jgi:FkbM family methyltransferase
MNRVRCILPLRALVRGCATRSQDMDTLLLAPAEPLEAPTESLTASGTLHGTLAFEPDPPTYALLAGSLELDPHDNLVAEQAGLSFRTSTVVHTRDAQNPGGDSFAAQNVDEIGSSVEVPIYRLDGYLADRGIDRRVDVIRIDVEGFEWKLPMGAAEVMRRDRPVVFCEITPSMITAAGDDHLRLLRYFEERGYQTSLVDERPRTVEPASFERAASVLADPNRREADLVFAPAERERR